MRILVISDTHGDLSSAFAAVDAQPSAKIIIHCGDGEREAQTIKEKYDGKTVLAVRGNCDFASSLPPKEALTVFDKKIFITHGHIYNAKFGIYNLVQAARESKADILLFGHTHSPLSIYDDGLYILNPGSCHGYGASYGYIDIDQKGNIFTATVPLK